MVRCLSWFLGLAVLCGGGNAVQQSRADEPAPQTQPSEQTTDQSAEQTPEASAGKSVELSAEPATEQTTEQIVAQVSPAVVVVTVRGRDGGQHGLGSGFIVSADGLIATNLHVIGEARPIEVQLADGRKFGVVDVHATDRALDLALIRIAAENLPALELGDSDQVQQGQAMVALGNPHGLRHSVVAGVLSSKREIEGREMLQLAIPIEPGNSGGPVVDRRGRVQGVITMKSAVTENLGFAVPINGLKALLEKPNPVPIARWLTIGALDPQQWKPHLGGVWQQRAGRLLATEPGSGFGGRSLCLYQPELPEFPLEIAVSVRLEDEAGAAGLAFGSDEADRHYGFYPSAGKLRLTRFDGPNVFSWNILADFPSEHYRPGEWNHLKVRLESDRIVCFVNDQQVFEARDPVRLSGKVGLAKFRDTQAEFKAFQVAPQIAPAQLSPETRTKIEVQIDALDSLQETLPRQLQPLVDQPGSTDVLRQRADALERQAGELRRLAADVHTQRVARLLASELEQDEASVDLARAALLIAWLDNEEVDVEAYLAELDRLAATVRESLPGEATDDQRLAALDDFLFEQRGFHGSRTEYYHQANSYLNQVLDDREGLPITLSVLYMELGRRLDLKIEGVSLPGHFVVRYVSSDGKETLIDVFERGKRISHAEAALKATLLSRSPVSKDHLAAAAPRVIIRRMISNLMGVAERSRDTEAMLRYAEAAVAIDQQAVADRGLRAVLRHQTGRRAAALADLDWILEAKPAGLDLDRIRQMREQFERR